MALLQDRPVLRIDFPQERGHHRSRKPLGGLSGRAERLQIGVVSNRVSAAIIAPFTRAERSQRKNGVVTIHSHAVEDFHPALSSLK
ncbi:hypothetical protein [Azospirillum doebereinerae]|uniref:Uncharacterized protein n=1 Tax=Azospirillum doebereinerae TaxID=92933 RepID=A0A3S0UXT5_9PROT|nr:hypothetical protein [Azospirillum doebereinerae]RUQ61418.1 hypothetical protein EJ913_29810 [Azospirillum doebereinerae]